MSNADTKEMHEERSICFRIGALLAASGSLDQRVAASYQQMSSERFTSVLHSQPDSEVVKMKFCKSCQEQFADRFSFCPVDGSALELARARERLVAEDLVKDSFEEVMSSELRVLLMSSRVPDVSPELYERLLGDYLDFMREKREVIKEAAKERVRRWWVRAISQLVLFLLAFCMISVIVILLLLGYVTLPTQLIYILLGIFGGFIGKGAVPGLLRGPYFPNESDKLPDTRIPSVESATFFPLARQT